MVQRMAGGAVVAALMLVLSAGPALADDPTPTPTPSATVTDAPTPTPTPTAVPTSSAGAVVTAGPDAETAKWIEAGVWALGALLCVQIVALVGSWSK